MRVLGAERLSMNWAQLMILVGIYRTAVGETVNGSI
jgi:hypothetical protein